MSYERELKKPGDAIQMRRQGRPRKKVEITYGSIDPETVWSAMECDEPSLLDKAVVAQLNQYFTQLEGSQPLPLYPLVVSAAERSLLVYVMTLCRNNQTEAAKLLGINRNTLHKKLVEHRLVNG